MTHQKKSIRKIHSWLKSLETGALFVIALGFLSAGMLILWASFIKLPDFNNFADRKVAESTKIYDRTGEILLYDVHENVKRTLVPFDTISPKLKEATIAAEDARFYEHSGIEPKSILRAVLVNLRLIQGVIGQGGSTITQQVIKKTLLTDEKRITRKVIFGKEPQNLTLTESAYLAALPNAPTRLSPYGNNRAQLDARKDFILKRMRELSFITEEEYTLAKQEKVTFLPKEPRGIKAPHFTEWIKE